MWIAALALSMMLALQGSAPAAPQSGEECATFGSQRRFDDGLKVALIATRQDDRFLLSRQTGPNANELVYLTLDSQGHLTFEGGLNPATEQAWRDAFGILKALPLETIRADQIQAFIAKTDVTPCGRKTFYWRDK